MTPRRSPAALAAIVLALLPLTPSRAATFRTTGSLNKTVASSSSQIDSYDQTGFTTTAGGIQFDDAIPGDVAYHVQANSQADPFGLHAHAHSSITKNFLGGGGFNYSQSGTAFAQSTYTDVLITGPAGAPPLLVSFNVHLDGSDNTLTTTSQHSGASAGTTVQLVFFAQGDNLGGGFFSDSNRESVHQAPFSSGSLAAFTGDDVITSPSFLAPVNTPFSIALQLTAFASVQGYFDDSFAVTATCDYSNTLTFATDRPVFNLPAGYTATSPDAAIVNNTFAVPEPATLSLLATTLILTTRARKNR